MEDVAFLESSIDGKVAVITLNRPRWKNAFNRDLFSKCCTLLSAARTDTNVTTVIITGSGDYFSAGLDMQDMLNLKDMETDIITSDSLTARFMESIITFPKLLVAAVNGPAIGIGVTLLMHCDYIVCTEDATFWTPFSRVAISPELCSSVTFPEAFGKSLSTNMLLFGQQLNSVDALNSRFVSKILPRETMISDVVSFLEKSIYSLPFHQNSIMQYKKTILSTRLSKYQEVNRVEAETNNLRFKNEEPQRASNIYFSKKRQSKL